MSPSTTATYDGKNISMKGFLLYIQRCLRLLAQIPNEVTDYYLQRVGFDCEDVRL